MLQRAAVKASHSALNRSLSMQRSLRLSLSLIGIAALALSNGALLPAIALEGSADDLGLMSISLKDVVRTAFGIQGYFVRRIKNLFLSKNSRGFYPNLIEEVFAALEIVVDLDYVVSTESDGFFLQVSCDGFFVVPHDIGVVVVSASVLHFCT